MRRTASVAGRLNAVHPGQVWTKHHIPAIESRLLLGYGVGDDPQFVQQFVRWVPEVHAVCTVVWDYGASSLSGRCFPGVVGRAGPRPGRDRDAEPPG